MVGMKAFLGALVLLSLLWLILYDVWRRHYLQKNSNLNYASKRSVSTGINVIPNRKTGKGARASTKNVTARAIKHIDVWKIIEAERQYLQRNPNVNYHVSKRRVPTGPNAIHNSLCILVFRKVGEYREPPTRA
ncbi:unnamed protein product [Withania somnifera]